MSIRHSRNNASVSRLPRNRPMVRASGFSLGVIFKRYFGEFRVSISIKEPDAASVFLLALPLMLTEMNQLSEQPTLREERSLLTCLIVAIKICLDGLFARSKDIAKPRDRGTLAAPGGANRPTTRG